MYIFTVYLIKFIYLYGLKSAFIYKLKVLEVWDLKDDKKIQSIELNFPSYFFPIDDFGPYPMSFFITGKESKKWDKQVIYIYN